MQTECDLLEVYNCLVYSGAALGLIEPCWESRSAPMIIRLREEEGDRYEPDDGQS